MIVNTKHTTYFHRQRIMIRYESELDKNFRSIQGHSQHQSENNGVLLPKYESEGLQEPTTVGSLDEKSKGYRLMLLYRLGLLEIFPIKVD